MKKNSVKSIVLIGLIVILSACHARKPYDYRPYLENMPASILVLPPVNESLTVMAPYMYLSIISRPIAEKGYYVFPVAVIDALMKENGVSSPEDMHRISLKKIDEIIHPDAVLYVNIKEWGTKYKVIDSQTIVCISAKLVDTDTGNVIWKNSRKEVRSSNDNANNIIEMLIGALVNQVLSNFLDPTIGVAHKVNNRLYYNNYSGLLPGKYHPQYQKSQKEFNRPMPE